MLTESVSKLGAAAFVETQKYFTSGKATPVCEPSGVSVPELSSAATASTGQALETIFIMMVVYLTLSLAVSVLMNAYNRRWKLRENAR